MCCSNVVKMLSLDTCFNQELCRCKNFLVEIGAAQSNSQQRANCIISTLTRINSWWRHQIETFSALMAPCEGSSPVTVEFPLQRPVARSYDVFVDLRLNKRLSWQSRRRWFETPSRPLWRHCNIGYQRSLQGLFYELTIKIGFYN